MAKRSYLKIGGELRLGLHDRLTLLAIDEVSAPPAPRYRLRFNAIVDGTACCVLVDPDRSRLELRPGYLITIERIGAARVDFAAESPEHIVVCSGPPGDPLLAVDEEPTFPDGCQPTSQH